MPRTARHTASSSTGTAAGRAGRDLDQDEVEELLGSAGSTPNSEFGRDLVATLAALPDRDRAVIELVDLAGLRPKEAAAALGLPPGVVRMRLMRTRARLRKQATTTNQDQG